MKTGAVAVENSVNAFHEHNSPKLKTRAAMPHYGHRQHYPTYQPQFQQPMQYQPSVYAPFQPQPFPTHHTYLAAQPTSVYDRYPSEASPMNQYGFNRAARGNQLLRPQPPQIGEFKRSVKSNQPPLPPTTASEPVQVQAPTNQTSRWCDSFAKRGNCSYGVTCKYSHGFPSRAPSQSAPAPVKNLKQLRAWPAQIKASTGSPIPSSLDDSNFPSLPKDEFVAHRRGPDGDDQSFQIKPRESSPKQLGFRDAVLRKHRKRPEVKQPGCFSPSKSSTSSEEESSEHTDDERFASSTHILNNYQKIGQLGSMNKVRVDDELRRRQIPVESVKALAGEKWLGRGLVERSADRATIQPPLPATPRRSSIVEPQIGQSGYAIHPVYLANDASASDDSTMFSALSRNTNEYVKHVDARLRSLVSIQKQAIGSLQELATSVWADSIVEIYGSNFTRLALPQSDIDCVISSPSLATEDPSSVLRKLAAMLQNQKWALRVELLDGAKIPVLKIVCSHSARSSCEVMLDLTCAHSPGHSGLSARDLIYSFQVEMPALRPLVLILKTHIQRRGLNSAFTGGLSSYGLVLLVIRFLQACGDQHTLGERSSTSRREHARSRSQSDNSLLAMSFIQHRSTEDPRTSLVYDFVRNGKLTWRTGLGNLLLFFLETYVTFDYRRFGITIENAGEYFPLPADKVSLDPGTVISPYIVDPIKNIRSIGNCFRMHEVVQAWYELYQQLTNGSTLEDAINLPAQANHPV